MMSVHPVMAGLVPATHKPERSAFVLDRRRVWVPGTGPGMTIFISDLGA